MPGARKTGDRCHYGLSIPEVRENNIRPCCVQGRHAVRTRRDGYDVRASIAPGLHITGRVADQDRIRLAESGAIFGGRPFLCDANEVSADLVVGTIPASLKVDEPVKLEC